MPTEFTTSPIGLGMATQLAQLPSGGLDTLLAQASMQCDTYCRRRLQAIGATTVGTGGIAAGGTSLPVASTLTFDQMDEQAVLIGTGGTQELVEITAGGVTPTTPLVSPYPGVLTLKTPCQYSHSATERVQGYLYEVSKAGSSSADDAYEQYVGAALSQQGQIAAAHAPMQPSNFTRKVFLRNYPILAIIGVEYAYSVDGRYQSIGTQGLSIDSHKPIYGLPYGVAVFPGGLVRTTYQAGFQVVPEDIKTATGLFVANMMRFIPSVGGAQSLAAQGIVASTEGKRSIRYGEVKMNKDGEMIPPLVAEARSYLEKYRRKM